MFDKRINQPLYESDNGPVYYSDFVNALKKIGIKKGDILFIHSDISAFGKLAAPDANFLLQSLVDLFKESVGEEGTVIMPTFSYSFCKNEVYDVENTKSTVGVLTEYFRKQKDVSRTLNPIFSCAIWGANKKEFLDIGKNCFGKNSIFEKIHKMNGKIITFGSPFITSCTYQHYVEKMHGVPHRFAKKFKGKIRTKEKEYEDEYEYFVRYLDKNVDPNITKFWEYLLEKGLMKEARVGNGRILSADCTVIFDEGQKVLDKNVYFFLSKTPDI